MAKELLVQIKSTFHKILHKEWVNYTCHSLFQSISTGVNYMPPRTNTSDACCLDWRDIRLMMLRSQQDSKMPLIPSVWNNSFLRFRYSDELMRSDVHEEFIETSSLLDAINPKVNIIFSIHFTCTQPCVLQLKEFIKLTQVIAVSDCTICHI